MDFRTIVAQVSLKLNCLKNDFLSFSDYEWFEHARNFKDSSQETDLACNIILSALICKTPNS